MKKSIFALKFAGLLIVASSLSGAASARDMQGFDLYANKCELIPPNDLIFGTEMQTGIDEETFNAVIDMVEAVYAPIVKAKGGNLIVDRRWNDNTVNAYASRQGKDWHVAMFGGLARHPRTTPDAFAMVICHEIGHQIGGAPHYNTSNDWAATEGQSDYWASLKCMRTVFAEMEKSNVPGIMDDKDVIDPLVKDRCTTGQGQTDHDFAVCVRSSVGGLALAQLLADLARDKEPKYDTPDTKVVKKTNERHPAAQCRLDTYFAGAVCAVDYKIDIDDKDPNIGVCVKTSASGDIIGARPACWYKQPEMR